MADNNRPPRGRRLLRVTGALVAPVLVVSGLALEWNDSASTREQDTEVASRTETTGGSARAWVASAPTRERARGTAPLHVAIARLGVQAPVRPIGVIDAALTPPSDPQQLGWWRDGARPGDPAGTAVITGHTVSTGGGALDDLEDLAPGDEIVVGTGRSQLLYDVASVRILSAGEVARQHRRLFAQGGPARLLLVTCEDWDGEAYRSSVIVVAEPR